jgi:hypothetical protein
VPSGAGATIVSNRLASIIKFASVLATDSRNGANRRVPAMCGERGDLLTSTSIGWFLGYQESADLLLNHVGERNVQFLLSAGSSYLNAEPSLRAASCIC